MARLRLFILIFLVLAGCMQSVGRNAPVESREWADLVKGIRFYEDRRYPEATQLFLKFIESYPGTPLLAEAQWLLAKSYDAAGRKRAAAQEFRIFLRNFPESSHQEEARAFLFRLESFPKKVIATFWFPNLQEPLDDSLDFYRKRGINTVIVIPLSDSIAQGGRVSDNAMFHENLGAWIEKAHLAGFQVVVRVPLRELSGLTHFRPEWHDRQFDPSKKELHPIAKLDLFNADVKEVVLRIFRDLALYPVDGIYVDAFEYRMEEGWTPSSLELYQNLFFEKLDPLLFLNEPVRSGGERPHPALSQFWHWVGWRSRFINSLLIDIQKEVEAIRPDIQFGVAVPEIALLNPVRSLAELSLDLLELKRSKFDFYFLISRSEASPTPALFDTLSRYAISPQEIWLQWRFREDLTHEFSRSSLQGFVLLNP